MKIENERFSVARSRCRHKLKFGDLTSSFGSRATMECRDPDFSRVSKVLSLNSHSRM